MAIKVTITIDASDYDSIDSIEMKIDCDEKNIFDDKQFCESKAELVAHEMIYHARNIHGYGKDELLKIHLQNIGISNETSSTS